MRFIHDVLNITTITVDKAAIHELCQQLAKANADHEPDTIVDAYAPDAVIYDLAPAER